MKKIIFTAAALLCGTLIASAQEPTIGMFGMPKAADCTFDPYVEAPEGFDAEREGIERGTVELVEYKSTTVGTVRKCNVYLPPKYDASKKYPVSLYKKHLLFCFSSDSLHPLFHHFLISHLIQFVEMFSFDF